SLIMSASTVSFVVPVLNGEVHLRRCLESMRVQMRPGDQLVLVDNGSTDGTLDIARSFSEVLVDKCPGLTVAGLRNVGAIRTEGALLAFVDSDCLLMAGWRDAVEKTLSDQTITATGCLPDVSADATWVERAWGSMKYKDKRTVRYVPAMNFVVRRSAFGKVGGFDERLVSDEDTDICTRLSEIGAVIVEDPQVAAIHLGNPRTLRAFVAKERWHATSIISTMTAHGIDRAMLMTLAFIGCGVLSLFLLALAVLGRVGIPAFVLPLLIVPLLTTAYRVWQHGNYNAAPALMVLYTLFYLVRSGVVIRSVLPGRMGYS
ncbi:MAG: glycosyltransferase, partial [candidate division Zixibacteria bacterium]|nr:glycosyltransferase [candidate division Zixibacteria bacterium]